MQIKLRIIDKYVIWKTKANKHVVDLPSHTVDQNRYVWNSYDWSQKGEEWTRHATNPEEWKADLLQNMMFRYLKPESIILEIGPGAGRWTEYLQKNAKHLILVDIAPKCIEMCKERFAGHSNIEYHVLEDNIDFLHENSIDFVWSYDVFVHVNPSDIDRYVENIRRILKLGGTAVIHHSAAEYESEKIARKGFRAQMTAEKFADIVSRREMRLLEQNRELVHKKGDIISVFTKA